MSLDNFRKRAIVWDTVNKDFPQPIQVMQGDVNARTLSVKIIDNGGEIDLTGHSLKLTYQYTNSSNSGFVMIPPENLTKGEFILVIPTEMTKPGVIEANLVLLNEDKEQVIVSKNLTFISDNSTVTDLAQEVNNKIDDFTKLLLENMPQVMRSELNDLHAQTESNTSNIELKANQTDLNNLQTTVNNQGITISTAAQETEVRSMISLLDNVKQTKKVARINLLLEQYKTSGYYRQYTNGEKLVNTDYDLFDMVPVNADTDYFTGISPNAHIAFYDFEQKYISGLLKPQPNFATPSSYLNTLVVKVPTKAKYMSYACNKNATQSVFYENDNPILDPSQPIFEGLLPFEQTANPPRGIKKVCNQNMFNKKLVVSGRYLDSTSGGLPHNANYNVYFMKVKPNTNYTTSGFVNNHDAFYDISGKFISSGNKSGTITTPANAFFWGISLTNAELPGAVICEGNVAKYSDFGTGAIFEVGDTAPQTLNVGADKKFTTIQAAVDFAKDGDTILISSGTYHEAVDAKTKLLHFKGVDKNTVTLEYENGAYSLPPLEISKGSVENMTIHAISQAQVSGEPGKAYCFHADYDIQIGHTLSFTNVKFINDDKQVIGVGLRNNFTLEFNSCDFFTPSGNNAFYVHDDPIRDNSSNQNLIVKDCSIVNNGTGATIHMQSQERVGAVAKVTWQRNIVVNLSGGKLIDVATYNNGLAKDKWLGSSDFVLQPTSALNNIPQLNFN
ncbi:neck passage structure [Lactococcus phage 936 group phage Phi19.2]|uniref:Neck passage structure n=2 Tax=Skunavirus sv193 TaxID=2845444 RepID=A0A126H9I1_9CAUD|nr:neck protein [Lactococcus phage 936 group phage Phi19.3]ALM63253.1 neck passage structure [Lactococcus phage 936 group phage Phi19.3]ALM64855.1 neck passage structure [Lactococcus phage 936 group phage Phi19.2]